MLQYYPGMDIRNTEMLPHGTGCRYLIVIRGQGQEYVAKQWARKPPKNLKPYETVIYFGARR